MYDIFEELTAHNKYPDTLVKIIEHEFSEIGSLNEKSISDLNMCSISNYKATPDKDFLFIKVGGKPRLIQPKSFFYEKLEEDNYSFFLQIEEEGYCDELYSDYVFNYGALYLYRNNETEEVIAGFWQYS